MEGNGKRLKNNGGDFFLNKGGGKGTKFRNKGEKKGKNGEKSAGKGLKVMGKALWCFWGKVRLRSGKDSGSVAAKTGLKAGKKSGLTRGKNSGSARGKIPV